MTSIDDLHGMQTGHPDPLDAAEQLAALWDLGEIRITAARLTGNGASAAVEIDFSNGSRIECDSLRDLGRPATLAVELAVATGVVAKFSQPAATKSVALISALGEWTRTKTETDAAMAWGLEYLQAAETRDVDIEDQRERYGAFEELKKRDPWAVMSERSSGFAPATLVLRCTSTGQRLVRVDWFIKYVKAVNMAITPQMLAARMARAGWERRGKRGWIKATSPATKEQLVFAFWVVPTGWGDDDD